MKPIQTEAELVEALFKEEDTILTRLYSKYAEELREYFLNQFPVFKLDSSQLEDIITDSFINICKNPNKFNPTKSSLKTFLSRDIKFDIINALEKKKSKVNRVNNNLVELDNISRNIDVPDNEEEIDLDYTKLASEFHSFFQSVFSKEIDQKLAWMIKIEKIKETKSYCKLLKIEEQSTIEQEEIVKKHKDRINVSLKRRGYEAFVKKLSKNA